MAKKSQELLDPEPLLMATLLEAKAALLATPTEESYAVIKKIMELEMSLSTKTVWAAAAMRHAKSMSDGVQAGVQPHPQEVTELLARFHLL